MKKRLMLVLCVLPVAAVVFWFIAGKNIGNLATIGFVLVCPLSHLLFMKHDHKREKNGNAERRHHE